MGISGKSLLPPQISPGRKGGREGEARPAPSLSRTRQPPTNHSFFFPFSLRRRPVKPSKRGTRIDGARGEGEEEGKGEEGWSRRAGGRAPRPKENAVLLLDLTALVCEAKSAEILTFGL